MLASLKKGEEYSVVVIDKDVLNYEHFFRSVHRNMEGIRAEMRLWY